MHVFETTQLWKEIIEEAGPKKVMAAVGRDLSTIYRWARSPMDVDPDGTGSRGLLDWFEAVAETLATRPHARPTLRKLQLWTDALFRRLLENHETSGYTPEEMRSKCGVLLRQAAALLDELNGGTVDRDRAITVCMETREQLERIVAALQAEETDVPRILRRA